MLDGNLYKLDLVTASNVASSSLNATIGSKHLKSNENSSILLHKGLGHIFSQRTERLVKCCIIKDLDLIDFDTCADCIKEKLTTKVRKSKTDRCTDVLDFIRTDICRPSIPPTMGGYIHFITFIDGFSRHSHVELIHEKSDSSGPFKVFKAKVELQKGKKIKTVNSNRYDE